MKHIKKISDFSMVGSVGAIAVMSFGGCGDSGMFPPPQQPPITQEENKPLNAFVVIEEIAPKKYKIAEEFPAKETRIILKTLDGKERVLTKDEMDELVKQEAAKIDEGKSELTNPELSSGDGGMGLGGVILSSMAGAIIGSWIGNKLFNNPTYQQQRARSYKSPQTYSKSKNSFNKAKAKRAAAKKSGFMKKSSTKPRSKGFFGGSRGGFFGG
jgi:hypothetical protein